MNRREFLLIDSSCLLALIMRGSCFAEEPDPAATQIAKLSAILLNLFETARRPHDESLQKIADAILRLADPGNQPSRPVVGRVADTLTAALEGRKCPPRVASQLATGIVGILDSVGGSTYDFHQSVNKAKNALLSVDVPGRQTDAVTQALTEMGHEIRGPEDTPASKFR